MFNRVLNALASIVVLAVLAGCSAAPAPCIIQRPPLGGYTIEFTRVGVAPSGCADLDVLGGQTASGPSSPSNWVDNLRFDLYFGNKIVFKSDSLPFDTTTDSSGTPLADSALIATAATPLPTDPTAEGNELYCTATNFNEITGFPAFSPLGLSGSEASYGITVTSAKFLNGATYQGSQLQVEATISFGSCSATYQGIGVTPSALLVVAPSCRAGDDTPCSPFANPDAGIAIGSGYNSAYPITCRADIGLVFVFGPPFSCLALDTSGNCTQSVDQYCLSPEADGTCKQENLDPDTRQQGVCFLPKGATFPALK